MNGSWDPGSLFKVKESTWISQTPPGIAREGNETTFLAGATTELGFSWRVGKARRLILEPHIQYPYFISQPPLIGIVPGISLGYLF